MNIHIRILRHDTRKIHFFNTYFLSDYENFGIERVELWTKNKNVNVFSQRMILFPYNRSGHWSLFVVINPEMVENFYIHSNSETNSRAW